MWETCWLLSPLVPLKPQLMFLVGRNYQVLTFRIDVANCSGVVAHKKQIWVIFVNSEPQVTAQVKCWLPGDGTATGTVMILGALLANILGRVWLEWKESSGYLISPQHLCKCSKLHLNFSDFFWFFFSELLTTHYHKNLHKLLTKEGVWVYQHMDAILFRSPTEVVLQIPTEGTTSIFRGKVSGHLMEGEEQCVFLSNV